MFKLESCLVEKMVGMWDLQEIYWLDDVVVEAIVIEEDAGIF